MHRFCKESQTAPMMPNTLENTESCAVPGSRNRSLRRYSVDCTVRATCMVGACSSQLLHYR